MSIVKAAMAWTLAGALMAGQMGQAAAAPMPTNVSTMKSMVAGGPTEVRWHGGWGLGCWRVPSLAAPSLAVPTPTMVRRIPTTGAECRDYDLA